MCCAACGTAEVDDINLKTCTACKSVRYCSIKCQKHHRPKHKRECKKRAAELRDEILFKQPESSHEGDCPICFLPLPLVENKSIVMSCCSKKICRGCAYANQVRELEGKLQQKCAFCRHPVPHTEEEAMKHIMKRVEANDPAAMCHMGVRCHLGGDIEGAFLYWTKAADAYSHYQLSRLYGEGKEAAVGGHPTARHNLGCIEGDNGRNERALKHWLIAAKLGNGDSLTNVRTGFEWGLLSKEDFAAALRGHQAAVDATKSTQRDEAEASRSSKQNLH
eukprot:scaffold26678_cov161-Skeletonema_marinoi.AAC.3